MKLNLDVIRFKLFGYIVALNLRVLPSEPLPYSFGYWRTFRRHYRVSPIVLYAPISRSRMFARCVKTADDRYRTASSPNVWQWRKRFAYSIYPLVSYCVHLTPR